MNRLSRPLLTLTMIVCFVFPSHAADSFGSAPASAKPPAATVDPLAAVRAMIERLQWAGALDELKRLDDSGNADWNNLMGYALRKSATPDLGASERYYDAALRIDPRHRNALEYSGELYLMRGEPDKADARLATLGTVCASQCDEYEKLRAAIQRYKQTGASTY